VHVRLRGHQRAVAGRSLQQPGGVAIFDDRTVIDDEDPVERLRVGDVVADADERGVTPVIPGEGHQPAARVAVETSERLVEHDQPDVRSQECASEADALTFAARNQRPPFPERRLEPVRELLDEPLQIRGGDGKPQRPSGV
jgi:hypothetical protein